MRRQWPDHPDLSDSSAWLPRTPGCRAHHSHKDLSLLTIQGVSGASRVGDTGAPGLEQFWEAQRVPWHLGVGSFSSRNPGSALGTTQTRTGVAAEFSSWISVVGGEGRHKSSKGHHILVPLQERI